MSVYDLPFCDYCGLPYKDGSPTCDCEQGWDVVFNWADRIKDKTEQQDERDDEAVMAQIAVQGGGA